MDQHSPSDGNPEFGKLRALVWPIHGYELKKFLPMLLIFFFISFIYSILRDTKDTLIVTAPGGGAHLIPFLKVYGVIPMSVVFMIVYSKLSNKYSKQKLFHITMAQFILFFLGFAVIFPIRESLQPAAAFGEWQQHLSPWLSSLAGLVRNWVLSLFYIMAELWGSMALSLMFWGFANDVVKLEESRRFYALFGVGANLALLTIKFANHTLRALAALVIRHVPMERWTAYVILLMALVLACILAIMLIYRWIHREVLSDPRFYSKADQKALRNLQPKMSLKEAYRVLLRSRTLLCIAIVVVAYGITTNLIEVTWKTHLGLLHPNPREYQDYMANFSFATGATTVFMMLFVANNVIRRYGWMAAALITPVVFLVTGVGFFSFILFEDGLGPVLANWGTTPLAVAVLFGTIQNVASKAAKYSLFDPTKEMAYIPLDQESKVKGKAAIDVVGARLGKAGGALINQVLIGLFKSLRAVPGPIATILFLIFGVWIWADLRLGRTVDQTSGAGEPLRLPADGSDPRPG
jgi:AAA family ATP:ADP antiporter